MSNVGGAANFFSAFKSLADAASAASTASDIYQTLTGTTGTDLIIGALAKLDADIKNDFDRVVNEMNEQELTSEWNTFQDSLSTINRQANQYLQDLKGLAISGEKYPGLYVVYPKGLETLFVDWCQNDVLTTLSSYVEEANYGETLNLPSLSGMFINAQVSDTDSALSLWVKIAQAAQKSSLSRLAKYRNKTVYELVVALMSEIYTTLGMIYYVHDASLKMLQALDAKAGASYISISSDIQRYFGKIPQSDTKTPSDTVWANFAEELNTLAMKPQTYTGAGINPVNPQDQIMYASMTCDQYPGGDASTIAQYYSTAQYQTNVPNSFFTALQLTKIAPPPPQGNVCMETAVELTGMLATIGAGLQLTANDTPPSLAAGCTPGKWQVFPNGVDEFEWTPSIQQDSNNINVLYPAQPTPTSNNLINVVTGFAFCQVGSGNNKGMGIALQFGELDVTDPNNPTVTVTNPTFVQPGIPDNPTHVGMPFTADLRPAGAYELDANLNPVNRLGIMTNASLLITHDVNGGRVGLNVQMAAPFYKADFFQPDNLPQLINTDNTAPI